MTDRPSPVVIVTGASRGIGAAAARWLGQAGATVILVARTRTGLEQTARQVRAAKGRAAIRTADVTDPRAAAAAVALARRRFGRLDGLINNAGVLEPIARLADADPRAWSHNLEVNLLAPFLWSQAALPLLRESRGRIVSVSSGAAVKAVEGWSAYCAAKAGVTHLTRVLAAEEPAVTTLALRPGVVDTAMQALIRAEGSGGMSAAQVAYFAGLKAEGQLRPPEIPGRVLAWLALRAPREWSGAFLDADDPRILAEVGGFGVPGAAA
jgi:NAD(P)-dependent dehydrogenase (short-subunit alcohol dehydrogenase family)